MNYCFQKKEKYLKLFIIKRLDEIDELSKIVDYGDLKFIFNNSGRELKDPVALRFNDS